MRILFFVFVYLLFRSFCNDYYPQMHGWCWIMFFFPLLRFCYFCNLRFIRREEVAKGICETHTNRKIFRNHSTEKFCDIGTGTGKRKLISLPAIRTSRALSIIYTNISKRFISTTSRWNSRPWCIWKIFHKPGRFFFRWWMKGINFYEDLITPYG